MPCILQRSVSYLPFCYHQRSKLLLIKPWYIPKSVYISRNLDGSLMVFIYDLCLWNYWSQRHCYFIDLLLHFKAFCLNLMCNTIREISTNHTHLSCGGTMFVWTTWEMQITTILLLKMRWPCPDQQSVVAMYIDSGLTRSSDLLSNTICVSVLRLAWLTTQHVFLSFLPTLTGRLQLIFREKLSPAEVQRLSRWADFMKKWPPQMGFNSLRPSDAYMRQ